MCDQHRALTCVLLYFSICNIHHSIFTAPSSEVGDGFCPQNYSVLWVFPRTASLGPSKNNDNILQPVSVLGWTSGLLGQEQKQLWSDHQDYWSIFWQISLYHWQLYSCCDHQCHWAADTVISPQSYHGFDFRESPNHAARMAVCKSSPWTAVETLAFQGGWLQAVKGSDKIEGVYDTIKIQGEKRQNSKPSPYLHESLNGRM